MTKNKTVNVIKFPATVAQIKTLVDGGIRVTFDVGEDSIMQVAQLLECKREMIPLAVEVRADPGAV
jgi:hypothetical protein